MRVRGLLVAVALLAALGGAVWWSEKVKKAEEGKPAADAPPKILSIAEDQFQQLEIKKSGAEATLLRKTPAGKWEMTAPKPLPVDQDAANGLVSTLSSLDSTRLVEEKASDLAQFGLASPGLEIAIQKKDGKTERLLIGDESPAGSGAFAKLAGDPRVFTIALYNKTSLDKTPQDLRDKRLLTFDSEKLVRLEITAKKVPVEFGKNAQNEWQILKPRPLRADGGSIEELIRKLKDAKMDTSLSPDDVKKSSAAFAGSLLVSVVKVTDAAGTQQLEIRRDKDKNYYARSSVVEGAHKVASDLGEALDKGLDDFRNKKLFDFGWNDPSKVEIRDGTRQYTFQKSGEKWMSGSTQMDGPNVQALVDRLRDLAAVKFVDSGFASVVLEAAVTSGDGKRREQVAVSKAGDRYYAKRENEPSIYELDGKAVEELRKAAADVKPYQPPKDEKKK